MRHLPVLRFTSYGLRGIRRAIFDCLPIRYFQPKPKERATVKYPCCGGIMKIVQTRIKNHRQTWQGKPALETQGVIL